MRGDIDISVSQTNEAPLFMLFPSVKRWSVSLLAVLMLLSLSIFSRGESVVAIKGGTVLTMAGKNMVRGVVLVRGGKIAEIGVNVTIPEEAVVIDASGKFIMPGIVDAMSYYGIRPPDRNDASNPVTPQNRVIHAYHPYSDYMSGSRSNRNRELLCGGVTTIYIAPGNRQVIGGQGAVVKTYGRNLGDMVVLEPASVDISMGDPVKSAFGKKQRSPYTRMGVASLLRKTLIRARDYVRKREASKKLAERTQAAGEEGKTREKRNEGKNGEKKENGAEKAGFVASPPDPGMEALARLLRKEVPGRVEANLSDDIRTAIRIADEFGIEIVIDGGEGAYKIKDILVEKDIPVVLSPISHPFFSGEPVDFSPEIHTLRDERGPALLAKAGVKISLASFGYGLGYTASEYHGRWLLLEAALAAGFGLSEEQALKAVTINPAEIMGVDDRIGSIAPGKDADIIILSGPPLDVKSWVERVLIDGELVYKK